MKEKKMVNSEDFLEGRNMIKEWDGNRQMSEVKEERMLMEKSGVRCNYAKDEIGFWFLVLDAGKSSLKKQRKNHA